MINDICGDWGRLVCPCRAQLVLGQWFRGCYPRLRWCRPFGL